MKRNMITINEELCNGCGLCVTGCAEGALQIVDGKAKLVKEEYCDGLGACLGECPTGALQVVVMEAAAYDPEAVETHLAARGKTHETHVHASGTGHDHEKSRTTHGAGCPGAAARSFTKAPLAVSNNQLPFRIQSQLRQWPIQMALIPSHAPYLQYAHLLLCADCVPAAYGDFQLDLLQGRVVILGCPKLDDGQAYVDKLTAILQGNDIESITVARVEVPCCGGLVRLAEQAVAASGKHVEVDVVTISCEGQRME